MSELKNSRKGKSKNEVEIKVEEQVDNEGSEKHCICESRFFMIISNFI